MRRDTKQKPEFLGPFVLQKDASNRTFKAFLDRLATELDHYIDQLEIRLIIRNCLTLAGVNPDDISNHSYRRGAATFCYAIGLPADSIRLLGDWRSNCYQPYIDDDFKGYS